LLPWEPEISYLSLFLPIPFSSSLVCSVIDWLVSIYFSCIDLVLRYVLTLRLTKQVSTVLGCLMNSTLAQLNLLFVTVITFKKPKSRIPVLWTRYLLQENWLLMLLVSLLSHNVHKNELIDMSMQLSVVFVQWELRYYRNI
jgi:hypothetical protein